MLTNPVEEKAQQPPALVLLTRGGFANGEAGRSAAERIARDMSEPKSQLLLEEDISVHIFTVSAGMVGVCLTVIGILRVVISARRVDTLADDLLSADAVLFLVSCVLSYWALRTRNRRRMHRVERVADCVFLSALLFMVVICGFITYAIARS